MRARVLSVLLLALAAVSIRTPAASATEPADISGDWLVSLQGVVLSNEWSDQCLVFVDVQEAGVSFALICANRPSTGVLTGLFDKSAVAFNVEGSLYGGILMQWTGGVAGDGSFVSGTWATSVGEMQVGEGTLSGERTTNYWGDADCTGTVTSADALVVLEQVGGYSPLTFCLTGDAWFDGAIGSLDALLILQYVAGLIPRLPVLPDA